MRKCCGPCKFTSLGEQYYGLGHPSMHSIFITEKRFVIEIEKSKQIQNFKIPFNSANFKPSWFLNFIFDNNFQIRQQIRVQWWKLSGKYRPYVNFWNTYSKYSKLDKFVQKKSIKTYALFWSQKLPFMVPMTNTNFVFK